MKNKGVTLIELLVIISIIGILIVAVGFSYEGWMGRYRIESQTKELYSDLMDARTRAMTRDRMHFVVFLNDPGECNPPSKSCYQIYDDYNPEPDGNGTLETDSDKLILHKDLEYDLELLPVGTSTLPETIIIDTRGLMSPQRDFRIDNDIDPDYDCLAITQARIRMGKWENCDSDAENECCEK